MAKTSKSRINLHQELQKNAFQNALISTYTFDPHFFENYCLQKFNSLNTNPNITVITDASTYANAIKGPGQNKTIQANIRYLFLPVTVNGVFHPKIFLFVNKNAGRLIIGSANFTRPGITSNAEMVGVYNYKVQKIIDHQALFSSAFQFFIDLNKLISSDSLASNIQVISRDAPWLLESESTVSNRITLLHNMETPLWDQIVARVKPPVKSVSIISRYFDSKPAILDRIIRDLNPNTVNIFTQNGITTLTENWLDHNAIRNDLVNIFLCEYKDAEYLQPLHAKAMYIESNKGNSLFSFGSANFTKPALLKTVENGNLEANVIIEDIKLTKKEVNLLFDPMNSAVKLKVKSDLLSAKNDYEGNPNKHPIFLAEAIHDENRIKIDATIPKEYEGQQSTLDICFHNDAKVSLPIVISQNCVYHVETTKDINHRLSQGSTIAQILIKNDQEIIATSNETLIVNLLDIKTGKNVRKERHIKEAQENRFLFFQVLNDLANSGDDDAFLAFLNHCDIPIINVDRPPIFKSGRPIWGGNEGMRKLGEINLKYFNNFHEASISFFDRHFKKLKRHIDIGGFSGISNFMHIWLAMGGILRNQVERALQGFEAKSAPMTPDEWYRYRKFIDTYFLRFEKLMNCLWTDYMKPLIKHYSLKKIKSRFEPDMNPLVDLCDYFLNARERLETFRSTKLKVAVPNGNIVEPGYFDSVLSIERWPQYSIKIKNTTDELTNNLCWTKPLRGRQIKETDYNSL
jgi:HKD family nuclease